MRRASCLEIDQWLYVAVESGICHDMRIRIANSTLTGRIDVRARSDEDLVESGRLLR